MSKPEPVDNPGGSDEPRKQLALIMWSGLKYYPERRIWELTDDDINNIMNKVLPYLRAHHKPQPTADAGELRESFNQYVLWMLVHLKRKLKVETTDLQNKLIESQAAMMAAELYRRSQEHFQHQADQLRRECEAEVVAAEDRGFREGQRVGQYQAADKLYHHTTTMWLFKDDLAHPNANMSERIFEMNKSCEKLLNHNSKVYTAYVSGDRYKRMHPKEYPTNQPTPQENTHE